MFAAVPWQMYELYGVSKEGKASNRKLKDQICVSVVTARVRQICDIFVVTLARGPRGENLSTKVN